MENRITTAHATAGTPLRAEVVSTRQGSWSLLGTLCRRHRRAAIFAMSALAMLIAGGVFSALQYFRARDETREAAEALTRAESNAGLLRRSLAASDAATARQLVHQGRPADALPHLARAVRLAPDHPAATADLLLLLTQTQLRQKAVPGTGAPVSARILSALLAPDSMEEASGAPTTITALDFSGPFLFSAEQAGQCRRWHVPTLKEVHPATPFPFRPLAIRALDDATAVVALADGSCHRWTAGSNPGRTVPPQRPPFGFWETAAISPQGRAAAFARAPRLYDPGEPASGYLLTDLAGGTSETTGACPPTRTLALSAQEELAAGWGDGRIGLSPQGQRQLQGLNRHRAAVMAVTFSGDPSRLLSGDAAGRLLLWDLPASLTVAELPTSVSAVAFAHNGSRFAAACGERIYLFDAASCQGLGLPLEAGETVTALALDRAGGMLAAGLERGAIRLWHLPPAGSTAPAWLADFAEAWAMRRLDASGRNVPLRDPAKPDTFRSAMETSRASHFAAAALYEWLTAPPAQRSLSPWAPRTQTEYVEKTARPGPARGAEDRRLRTTRGG